MVDREVELELFWKVWVRARRQVGARRERSDRLGTGLGKHAELLAKRVFEVESPEERVEPRAKLLISDGVVYIMRATHLVCIVRAVPGEHES